MSSNRSNALNKEYLTGNLPLGLDYNGAFSYVPEALTKFLAQPKWDNGQLFFEQGNFAIAEGALTAGCRFMAGYPITPATEISELMSKRLPELGGYYLQFEDELGSIHALFGAATAGVKAMTATSGPGYSLFHDGYSWGIKNELPGVIVNSTRVGPANGISAQTGAGEFYASRYVTHGGNYETIVLSPSSVQEAFWLTIESFNLAEIFNTPVTILTDKTVSDMRETLYIPPDGAIKSLVIERVKPPVDKQFKQYPWGQDIIFYPRQIVGEPCGGLGLCVAPYTSTVYGYPKEDFPTQEALSFRLINKIRNHKDLILRYEALGTADAELILVSYGCTSRPLRTVYEECRRQGLKVGYLRLISLWPFPEELFTRDVRYLVCEMNYEGQMVREVERAVPDRSKVNFLGKCTELFNSAEVKHAVHEILQNGGQEA